MAEQLRPQYGGWACLPLPPFLPSLALTLNPKCISVQRGPEDAVLGGSRVLAEGASELNVEGAGTYKAALTQA